jgi:transcription elongation factor GreA
MTQQTETSATVWLAKSAYDQLAAQLEDMKGPQRQTIVAEISNARDEGDLKENAGYHAARDELGKVDGRIKQLTDMLERAEVGETPADDGVVEPGMKVTVKLVGLDLEETFLFGAREMGGDDIKVYSPQSPLGQAIDGAKRGETVTYTLPNGKDQKAEILEAVPYTG